MRLWNNLFFVFVILVAADDKGNDTTEVSSTGTPATSTETVSKPTLPTSPPTPDSELTIHFVNNLRYQWYPVKDNGELCQFAGQDACKGGLECIAKKLNDTSVLISAGNILSDPTTKTDYYKAMKFAPAIKTLNSLKIVGPKAMAMLMGHEMFRYGGSQARKFVQQVEADFVACNLNSTEALPEKSRSFIPYVDFPAGKIGGKCGIRVIGFADTNKTELLHPEKISVFDEIESIKKVINSTPRDSNIIIVVGEGTKEMAEKISKIKEVDIVLLSGSNVTDGDTVVERKEEGRNKALIYKELTGRVVKLKIPVVKCDEIEVVTAEELHYDDEVCKPDPSDDGKLLNQSINLGATTYELYEKDLLVKTASPVTTEHCSSFECTIGLLATDAVASAMATVNLDFPLESRAVLLPSGVFIKSGNLTEPVSQKSLLDTLNDDTFFYNVYLTTSQLKELVENMIHKEESGGFPQLSGFRLYIDLDGETGNKVDRILILDKDSIFHNVRFNKNEVYRVILPLHALLKHQIIQNVESYKYEVTDTFLSSALASFIKSDIVNANTTKKILLSPPLGERITYVLPPSQSLCENLIAITICYTILLVVTLSSLSLLGYKIYSDRTAVHYVR